MHALTIVYDTTCIQCISCTLSHFFKIHYYLLSPKVKKNPLKMWVSRLINDLYTMTIDSYDDETNRSKESRGLKNILIHHIHTHTYTQARVRYIYLREAYETGHQIMEEKSLYSAHIPTVFSFSRFSIM